jgi:osmotically-inducible protein OsmY
MQTRANGWLGALAALALLSSAACGRGDYKQDGTAASNPPATAESQQAQNNTPDWWTTTKIQAQYFADDVVKGGGIDVTTNDGVVTLSGTVQSEAAKERAVALARKVDGVSRVDDKLQVRAQTTDTAARNADGTPVATSGTRENGVNPGWITTKIQAQYYADPGLKPWNIDVTTVGDGSVTLSGEIDNEADKAKAVSIARNTEGVTAVDDRLRVKTATAEPAADSGVPEGMQPDAWVTAKIQSKYFMDPDVKGSDINVTTNSGVVTLEGTARTDAEKRQAVAIARSTDGVKDVQDRLTISPSQEPAARSPLPQVAGGDAWITTKIQSKYFMDRSVKSTQINVDTADGVVTLTGTVPDAAAKQTAEAIARETTGVKRVVNNLQDGG